MASSFTVLWKCISLLLFLGTPDWIFSLPQQPVDFGKGKYIILLFPTNYNHSLVFNHVAEYKKAKANTGSYKAFDTETHKNLSTDLFSDSE